MNDGLKCCQSGDAVWRVWERRGQSRSQGCANSDFSVKYGGPRLVLAKDRHESKGGKLGTF